MEKRLADLYQALQKLIAHHRQLLETVRSERDALAQADLQAIQKHTYEKEALIEAIRVAEATRLQIVAAIEHELGAPESSLRISELVRRAENYDPKVAADLQASYQALVHLIDRITEHNRSNRELIERSLEHVRAMKGNVLNEAAPASATYSPQGTKRPPVAPGARLISKEA